MANYHTLNDYNQAPNNGGYGGFQSQGGPPMDEEAQRAAQMFSTFSGGEMRGKAPREYNFWDFWKYTFCANFTPAALPFVVFAINTVVFVVSLFMMLLPDYQLDAYVFLGVDAVLMNKMQAMNPYEIVNNYQLWRFVTPLFITMGFQQYVNDSIFLLIFGYMFQGCRMPFWKQVFFYLVIGSTGYLFACVCNSEGYLMVGASPAICGLVGGIFASLIRNIQALRPLGNMRFCILVLIVFLFVIYLLYTMPFWIVYSNDFKGADPLGMFGGFLTGTFVGLFTMPTVRAEAQRAKSFEKITALVGLVGFGVMFAVLSACLFLAENYSRFYM